MSEKELQKLQNDVANLDNKIDRILLHFESDESIGHVGIAEQVKRNAKDIDKLKIDKKVLLGIGTVTGGLISGAFWLGSKLKAIL